MRLNLSKPESAPEVYAHGVRNTVGFTWHPDTEALWFTDNGRDHLGDEIPPCELNIAAEPGMHFGYPFIHGKDVIDPKFGPGPEPDRYVQPALELGAHVAPLGLEFYRGNRFPEKYRQLFIAEHGSWNRSSAAGHVGYRITMAVENNGALEYETFIDGWLDGTVGWGRPVDLLALDDGTLLISDDTGNVIYKVVWEQP